MESQTLVRNGGTTGIWRQLPGEAGLRLDRESCLPFRYRTEGCSACADACPRGAISLLPGDLAVSAECVGCGRCMAACPMGALDHPGFEPGRETAGADARPLPVECKRIPASQRTAGAVVVPCLGGIEAAWLMERQRPSGGVRLMDRGLCQGCPAGGGEVHPVSRALDHARDLLETMGIPLSRLPSLERDELPAKSPAGGPVPPAGGANLSRRAFFGRLARTAEAAVFRSSQSGEPTGTRLARGPKTSRARWRLLAASMSLARSSGLPVPHGLFVQATITQDCCARGLCAAVCPTGALEILETEGAEARVFKALDCIACGACASACPEQALRIDECHDESWRQPRELVRIVRHTCVDCGSEFADAGGYVQCEACRKSQDLVKDVYQQLFSRNA